MKKVVVTGCAGFIASHLTEALIGRGYDVVGLDNFVTGSRDNLKAIERDAKFKLIEADVSDSEVMKSIFQSTLLAEARGVFHMASPASPVDFERIPFEIMKVNGHGTQIWAEWAIRNKARFLFASTSEVYGDPLVHPQKESYFGNVNSIGPRACYDESKRFAEAFVASGIRWKNLDGRIVRIFNTYGPRMRLDDGRVVPEFFKQAMKNEPLPLHGGGKQTRSFCYVSDLVEGIIRTYESDVKEPINLGNPAEISVATFAEKILALTQSKSKVKEFDARDDDPKRRCPDISRAKQKLNWEPKVDLDQGLRLTYEFFNQLR